MAHTYQDNSDLVHLLLEDDQDKKMEKEDVLHLLLESKVSKNINTLQDRDRSMGARAADAIARFAGSWIFILIFTGCLLGWIVLNAVWLSHPYDPYPFILLNLMLSCVAAIQAPVIMMSQNRQESKDRLRALNDYKVNLKSEIIVESLHDKLDELLVNQKKMLQRLDRMEKKARKETPAQTAEKPQ